jgi:hypothetical protein
MGSDDDPHGSATPVSERSPRALRFARLLERLDSALITLHRALNPDRLPLDDRGPWRHNEVMWEANLASSLAREAERLGRQPAAGGAG